MEYTSNLSAGMYVQCKEHGKIVRLFKRRTNYALKDLRGQFDGWSVFVIKHKRTECLLLAETCLFYAY